VQAGPIRDPFRQQPDRAVAALAELNTVSRATFIVGICAGNIRLDFSPPLTTFPLLALTCWLRLFAREVEVAGSSMSPSATRPGRPLRLRLP